MARKRTRPVVILSAVEGSVTLSSVEGSVILSAAEGSVTLSSVEGSVILSAAEGSRFFTGHVLCPPVQNDKAFVLSVVEG